MCAVAILRKGEKRERAGSRAKASKMRETRQKPVLYYEVRTRLATSALLYLQVRNLATLYTHSTP